MKNLLKYSVLAISIGLASACSGGSGGNNDTPNPAYDKKEVNANTQVPSIYYVRDNLKAEVTNAKTLEVLDPVTKQTLKTINLADYPKGTIKETFPSMGNADLTYARIINLSYSQALTLHTNEYGEIAYQSFAGGYPTSPENLPKGSATYNGTSLGLNSSGLLSLTADFDSKTVQGNLYNRRHENGNVLDNITLEQSRISTELLRNENTGEYKNVVSFTGSTRLPNERGSYYGMFAGPNAEEVAGFVSKSYLADPYEAFAGEKQ